MNRYVLVRRLHAPAFILLTGVMALLAEWNILGWGKSWPLYLILYGLLKLAERAALASMDPMDVPGGYPPPAPGQPVVSTAPPVSATTAIVPSMPENHSGESGQ